MERGRDAVMGDDELRKHGLPVRHQWNRDQWLAFQNGWGAQREGSPASSANHPAAGSEPRLWPYFEQGVREAEHFRPKPAP